MAEQGEGVEEGLAAVLVEGLAEEALDGVGAGGVGGEGLEGGCPADHEVDHAVDAPGDVVFEDALGGVGRGGRAGGAGLKASGQAGGGISGAVG
ncbi:MAG: hypothetical protein AAF823_10435 [Planctomycetota bacterium]